MDKCIHCDVPMVPGESALRVVVGDLAFENMVPALLCPKCGESYVDHGVASKYELDVARELALTGPATGVVFRFLRKALRLPAAEVGALFGVTPTTISRWETGKERVNVHVLLTLGSLVLDHINNVNTTEERLRRLVA